jgi:hypothetical protein
MGQDVWETAGAKRVADCFVDVDTIRYSVPHKLVRCRVEVLVGETEVVIFEGQVEVARHRRGAEPRQRIANPKHFDGLYRKPDEVPRDAPSPFGRSLEVYAEAAGGSL